MKYILIIASLFVFSGCIVEKKPSITEYKIIIKHDKTTTNSSGCSEKTLKISQAFSPSNLQSLKMNYIKSDTKVFAYSKALWMESPKYSISQAVFLKIRDTGMFKNVNIAKSRSTSQLILEIIIEDFIQYYNERLDTSYVNVSISLNLLDATTLKTISSKSFSSKVDTKNLNAEAGVDALNIALSNILEQNVEWLDGVCK